MVRTHYRSPLNYSDAHLDDARNALRRLYTALELVAPDAVVIDWADPVAARFKAAMDEDFGTPEAIAVLFELAADVNRNGSTQRAGLLKALAGSLGLLQGDPMAFKQWRASDADQAGAAQDGALSPAAIADMITQRAAAKAGKNFAEADRIRKALLDKGVVLKDTPAGTTWESAQ